MSVKAIRTTLVSAYLECNTGLPTTYGNAPKYVPTIDQAWANLYIIPNMPVGFELGQNGSDDHTGIIQIDLFYPLGKGDSDMLAMCDKIRQYFVHGKSVTYNGQAVTFGRSGGRGPRNEDGQYKESMTINWRAKVARSGA